MTFEEAISELEWIYQNGFENDLSIIGTDRILDSIRMAIEALEKQIQKKPIRRVVEYKYCSLTYRPFEMWVCPICNKAVEVDDNEEFRTELYPSCECGQRIDWTGILEDYECKWNDYEVK